MAARHRHQDIRQLTAHTHPEHRASIRVAERLELTPTQILIDDETPWTTPNPQPQPMTQPDNHTTRRGGYCDATPPGGRAAHRHRASPPIPWRAVRPASKPTKGRS
jgi:hypothetical protein